MKSFRALRHRNFRLYWIGQLISLAGTWMQSVAQAWLMHRLTASPWMLGLLGFAQFSPVLLFTLWAGALADRMDKRRLILLTQGAAALQAAALAAVVSAGVVQPWMVLALAFVFGTINSIDLPARQSFIVEMVGGKDDLPNAIALSSAAFNTARIIGPALAGLTVAAFGEAVCFWINAVSFVPVLAALAMMRLPRRVAALADGSTLARMAEGARYAAGSRPIRSLLILLAVCAGLGFQYNLLLPIYADTILKSGAAGMGLMVSAFGIGSLLAAAWMTLPKDRPLLRRQLLIGLLTAGVGMSVFAWSRWMPLTLAMGFLSGFGLILYVSSTNILLQLTTEDEFRGRVMGFYTFMFVGTAPIGALIAGAIAQRWGAPLATSFSALVLLGGAVEVLRRLRVLAARAAAEAAPVPALTERVG